MKHRLAIIVGFVIVAIALIGWRLRGRDEQPSVATSPVTASPPAIKSATAAPRPDPTTLVRGSIAGTVTQAESRAPLANAMVCARGESPHLETELLRVPTCAVTDAAGAYVIANLFPARYRVSASAPTFMPELYTSGQPKNDAVWVSARAARTGIDLALYPGGVEVTGTVADITGGPIEKARLVR